MGTVAHADRRYNIREPNAMSGATTLENVVHWVSSTAQKRVPYDAANRYLEGPLPLFRPR